MNHGLHMPTGEVSLKLKGADGSLKWESVAIIDDPTESEIRDIVKYWRSHYEVLAVRYNGWNIPLPKF